MAAYPVLNNLPLVTSSFFHFTSSPQKHGVWGMKELYSRWRDPPSKYKLDTLLKCRMKSCYFFKDFFVWLLNAFSNWFPIKEMTKAMAIFALGKWVNYWNYDYKRIAHLKPGQLRHFLSDRWQVFEEWHNTSQQRIAVEAEWLSLPKPMTSAHLTLRYE